MRILYVLHCYMPDSTGGTEVHVSLLANALRAQHDVAVCYRVARPGRPDRAIERGSYEGVPTYGIVNNFGWSSGPEDAYRCPALEPAFETILDEFHPDLVHFHHLGELSTTLPAVARARGIPTVLTLHDFWYMCSRSYLMTPWDELCPGPDGGQRCGPCWDYDHASSGPALSRGRLTRLRSWGLRGTLRRLCSAIKRALSAPSAAPRRHLLERDAHFRQVLAEMDEVWAPSRFLRDRIARWADLPEGITYLPNGINPRNLEGYAPALPNGPRLQLGFVGTVSRHKGAEVLLEAMEQLLGVSVDCRIYGGPREADGTDYLRSLEQRFKNPAVRFMGRVPNSEIGQVLSGLDVLVVPSVWWENCPMTILEAQYARRPVIATNIGGMAELVHEGLNGLTFPPGDATTLAEAIRRLVADRDLLQTLQQGIVAPPSMTEVAALALARYQELLTQRRTAEVN